MASTKERRPNGVLISDRTVDDLIDERIIAAEEQILRDSGVFSNRLRAAALFVCCIAWLCLSYASLGDGGSQVHVAHSHGHNHASVSTDSSLRGHSSADVNDALKAANLMVDESDRSSLLTRDDVKSQQIRNYLDEKALIMNFYMDDRPGLFICEYMRRIGNVPRFNCIHETSSWNYNETSKGAALLREEFHMISWDARSLPVSAVNLEDSNIVSMIIMQDPMNILRSAEENLKNNLSGQSQKSWTKAARSFAANHSALIHLTGCSYAKVVNSTDACLVNAKKILENFTFVLDQACLAEGLKALAKKLDLPAPKLELAHRDERMQGDVNTTGLHDFMSQQLQSDMDLYEWSKDISIVRC